MSEKVSQHMHDIIGARGGEGLTREREQQQSASSESVNGPDSRPSEQKVDQSEAPGSKLSLLVWTLSTSGILTKALV
jgi:hypothetical protein